MTTAEFFAAAEVLAGQLDALPEWHAGHTQDAPRVRGAVEYLRPLVSQLPADGVCFWFAVRHIPELRPLATYDVADWSHLGADGTRLAATCWPTPEGRAILERTLEIQSEDRARWRAEIAAVPEIHDHRYSSRTRSQEEDDSM